MKSPKKFSLVDEMGEEFTFPSHRACLIAFVKEDCETCNLTLPILEVIHKTVETKLDVLAISQKLEDIEILRNRHNLTFKILDDDSLAISYQAELDTVPSVFLYDENSQCKIQLFGFVRDEWELLLTESLALADKTDAIVPIDWKSLPTFRPGCGARNVEPGINERLTARMNGKLMARQITIGEADDLHEFIFDANITDGLPIVPPTPERVWRMLKGTRRDPQDIIANVPPNLIPVTVEKIAINSVMAGARPEYFPIILTAVEAACSEEFNIHGVLATTWFVGPIIIVNGPIRKKIGMNAGINALGQGNRANLTIGRALQLVIRNIGGGRPGEIDRAVLGGPHKISFCFPENEERSPWSPLHVERGFSLDESTVTLFAGTGPQPVADQLSREARPLVTSIANSMQTIWNTKNHNIGETFLILAPEHVETISRSGWNKNDIRKRIQEATAKPLRELIRSKECGEGMSPESAEDDWDRMLPKFQNEDMINIVVAGGDAGKFSAILAGWQSGPKGSQTVTRKIIE